MNQDDSLCESRADIILEIIANDILCKDYNTLQTRSVKECLPNYISLYSDYIAELLSKEDYYTTEMLQERAKFFYERIFANVKQSEHKQLLMVILTRLAALLQQVGSKA